MVDAAASAERQGQVACLIGLMLRPRDAWPIIAAEPARPVSLFLRYAMPLAAIGPVCLSVGVMLFGAEVSGAMFYPAWHAAVAAGFGVYAVALLTLVALAGVINAFAPVFDAERDFSQSLKLAIFSSVPGWLAGVFLLIPGLWIVNVMIGFYGLYLLFLGLPVVMDVHRSKCGVYTALVSALLMVIWGVGSTVNAVASQWVMIPPPGSSTPTGRLAVPGVGEVDLGRAGRAIESGRLVLPVPPDELETLLPAALGDYTRLEVVGNTMSVGRVGGSMARGIYGKDDLRVTLTVSDVGAASALAAAFKVKSSRRTETSYETAGLVDGRMTVEKYDRTAHAGEYSVLVAGRFLVQARGQANIGALKDAVFTVPFDRLEAMGKC